MNLIDGLNEQLTRAGKLLKLYEGILTGGCCAGTDEDKKQCPFWNKGDF